MDSYLRESALRWVLGTHWLGQSVSYFVELGSTNDWLKQQAATRADLPHGHLVVTDYQTAGKGRLDRRWDVPAHTSLLFSLFLRPNWHPHQSTWLTMLAGVAVVHAIQEQTGLHSRLKWPNDLVIPTANGQYRKLGGILVETVWENGLLAQAIVGMGLNVNVEWAEPAAYAITPTSILIETGQSTNRLQLLAALLKQVEQLYDQAVNGFSPQEQWDNLLIWRGEPVLVQHPTHPTVTGVLEGTNQWGNLLLRDSAGTLRTIPAGEVSLRSAIRPLEQTHSPNDNPTNHLG